jgi:hypothetical protein
MQNHQFKIHQILAIIFDEGIHKQKFFPGLKGTLDRCTYWTKVLFKASYEPIIRHRSDLSGVHFFRVYDPATRTHHLFASEAEARAWLEDRHHRQ